MNIPPLVILHDDLIVEVLMFLDIKSLMSMKCVSKSWKTLILDPDFAKMHLKKQSTRTSHLAILSNMSEGSGECRAVPISRLLESNSHSITLTDPYHQFFYKDAGRVVGSCNGLVCMQDCYFAEYHEHSFSFWNPATRTKSETLVSFRNYPKPRKNVCNFTFGYDISIDTYKIVFLCLKRDDSDLIATAVRVFTLGDNDWRDIDCLPVVLVRHPFELHNVPTLSVLMDCLYFSYDSKKTHFVIWQMKEFGVEESWTQFLKISYTNLLNNFKTKELYNDSLFHRSRLTPMCFSENGDTLIFAINIPDQAILYNWKDNRAKIIESTNKILWFTAKGYVESLVSTS
ncbi:F-box protein interaction domain protein [Medicago truncatula]|uniref:F-box protein interaction domain protein n=1 Tax=Medicago truncatula TaxID=3880 RepID=A0A072U6P9_MEDTR|nr:F-box protein interaction domain protein [Medicago truncatula]